MVAGSFALLAGLDTAVHPIFHLNMDIDAASQARALDGIQQPWLEYSVWQEQEWMRVYTPGQPQLWHPDDDVPVLPENTFRVWKPVVSPSEETQDNEAWQGHYAHDHRQIWTIQDWQHQGYQRILTRYESFSTHNHNASDQQREGVRNPDFSIQVEELGSSQHGLRQQDRNVVNMFTYAPPMTDTAHPSSLLLPPVLPSIAGHRGGLLPAQVGDPASPSSERRRTERAISRSPRRCGYFGRH